ncbi:MAG: glycosyltransferase family 4 protein [Clostridia bacterium]
MQVTIVTAYFAPEITPITHLYQDLAADLSRYGAEVTVVTGMANRGLNEEQRAAYQTRTDEHTPEGFRILRVGNVRREGSGLLSRGLHFLSGTVSLYRVAKHVPTDVYLLGSMPPFLGLVGAQLSKRARTVYILQDIFPDSMLLMGKLSEHHPVIRLCRWMERRSYRKNTRLITVSEDMKKTLLMRGVPQERLDVIGNWADTEAVRPVTRADNPLFDELALSREGFYAIYAGTLGILQCPDLLLDAAKLLKDQAGITLLILGGGALTAHVRTRMETEEIANVKLFPLVSADRVSEAYSLGDVALVPLVAGTTRVAMPSKTWSAMSAGRPVIITAERDSAWAELIAKAGCGYICPPGDAETLADALLACYYARDTLPQMGARARTYVENECSRRQATSHYYEVLTKE